MSFPCSSPASTCTQNPNPSTDFSSEAADSTTFIGMAWAPAPPLLNKSFDVYPCEAITESQVSQDTANLAAQQAAVICANPCSPTFSNTAQTATGTCANGSQYFYTAAAGLFTALSQILADRQALGYAQTHALGHPVCLALLSQPGACQGLFYSAEIVVSSTDNPVVIELLSGQLPPGITMVIETGAVFISGTPTTLGTYNFALKATSSAGTYTTQAYQIFVTAITTGSSLPTATHGTPYSQQLNVFNPNNLPVVWSIVNGQLPAGLTLDAASGIISGNNTNGGMFNFTVQASLGGASCTAGFTMQALLINFANMAWSGIINHPGTGFANSSFGGGTFTTQAQGSSGPATNPGYVEGHGQMSYTGPTVACKAVVTVNSSCYDGGATGSDNGFILRQDGVALINLHGAGLVSGTYNFTIIAGTNSLITVDGVISIADPNQLFVYSINNTTGSFTVTLSST